jgi:hypothetical protein
MDATELSAVVDCLSQNLGEKLRAVVLFGSVARGEATTTSDVDLLVVATQLPHRPLVRSRLVHHGLAAVSTRRISVLAKTPDEVDRDVTPLLLEVGLDGIILLDRSFFVSRQIKLRQLLRRLGLHRVREGREAHWEWDEPPPPGRWEISWDMVGSDTNQAAS